MAVTNSTIDPNILAPELLMAPNPLVGFFGLDAGGSTVQKTIWDAFSANRKPER